MNLAEAHGLNRLFSFLVNPRKADQGKARDGLTILAEKSYARLMAGVTPDQVNQAWSKILANLRVDDGSTPVPDDARVWVGVDCLDPQRILTTPQGTREEIQTWLDGQLDDVDGYPTVVTAAFYRAHGNLGLGSDLLRENDLTRAVREFVDDPKIDARELRTWVRDHILGVTGKPTATTVEQALRDVIERIEQQAEL